MSRYKYITFTDGRGWLIDDLHKLVSDIDGEIVKIIDRGDEFGAIVDTRSVLNNDS